MYVCFKGGYIDSWGWETINIIEACKEAGLPEPVLKEEQGGFLSKIFISTVKVRDKFGKDSGKIRDKFGKTSQEIIALIHQDKFITIPEMAQRIGVSSRTVEKHTANIKEAGLVERIGSRKEGFWALRL